MEHHTTTAMTVLRRSQHLRLPKVGATAGQICAELYAEAQERGLKVEGVPIFAARGLPQDSRTVFELDICLPVAGDGLPTLPAMHCVRRLYEGPLTELFTRGYQPLLQAIAQAGLQPNGNSREIYHVWHGPGANDNRIEIQIGIAP